VTECSGLFQHSVMGNNLSGCRPCIMNRKFK